MLHVMTKLQISAPSCEPPQVHIDIASQSSAAERHRELVKMADSSSFAASKVRSQSDSNLLGSAKPEENGAAQGGSFRRNVSVEDLDYNTKKRNFFYKLVRPWKWRRKRRTNKTESKE